ncbi:MAG: ferredoxin [Gemmatimonadota bacterium]
MNDTTERTVGGITVRIDRLLCVGFGDCIDEAPQAFALDDEGIAEFGEGVASVDRGRLIRACEACPVDALSVYDANGDPVAAE